MNFFKKLKESLTGNKTEDSVTSNQDTEKKSAEILKRALRKQKTLFGNFSKHLLENQKSLIKELDSIEETLLKSDIGIETSLKIIDGLENRVRKDKFIHFQ